jgi:hypothetical protein
MVAEIPSSLGIKNCTKALTGKNMLAITSFPISNQIDDALKRARNIAQRLGILLRSLTTQLRNRKHYHEEGPTMNKKWIRRIHLNIKRLYNRHNPFTNSVSTLKSLCIEKKDERNHHIEAIECARNKKLLKSSSIATQSMLIPSLTAKEEMNITILWMKSKWKSLNIIAALQMHNIQTKPHVN